MAYIQYNQAVMAIIKKTLHAPSLLALYTIQMSSTGANRNDLTPRQAEVLEFIRQIKREGGSAPTYREITVRFGFRSTKAAEDHIRALERKGHIRCHGGRSRGIELLSNDVACAKASIITVPILGNIPAGYPDDRTEEALDTLMIDPAILGVVGSRLFALRVTGDSMEGRGIYEGDWVIADAADSPHEGNIVVALIDGQNTLKTLARENGRYFLRGENRKYTSLVPLEIMEIQGVVKAVMRRVN